MVLQYMGTAILKMYEQLPYLRYCFSFCAKGNTGSDRKSQYPLLAKDALIWIKFVEFICAYYLGKIMFT